MSVHPIPIEWIQRRAAPVPTEGWGGILCLLGDVEERLDRWCPPYVIVRLFDKKSLNLVYDSHGHLMLERDKDGHVDMLVTSCITNRNMWGMYHALEVKGKTVRAFIKGCGYGPSTEDFEDVFVTLQLYRSHLVYPSYLSDDSTPLVVDA